MSTPALLGPGIDVRPGPLEFAGLGRRPLGRGRRVRTFLALATILALFAARCGWIAATDSITPDETIYLRHGLHYWQTGDDLKMWDLGSPRLPHLLNTLPSYLVLTLTGELTAPPPAAADGGDFGAEQDRIDAINGLVLSDTSRALRPARAMAIAWGCALLLIASWAVGRRRGAAAGLIAAAILALVPEVVAHSAIACSDVPFAATSVLATALLARCAERPGAGRWTAAALAIGLAWATRHTAILLLPIAAVVHLKIALDRRREAGRSPARCLLGSALATAGLAGLAFLVLWAGDGFGTVSAADVLAKASAKVGPLRAILARGTGPAGLGAPPIPIPIPSSAVSLIKQIRHQNIGHEAFFCGERGDHGWPSYFPVAFGLKTPVGLLILLTLAAARFRPRDAWEWTALALLALLWAMLVRSKVDIGLRYALLTYPLAVPFLARLFEPSALRDRVWGPATLVAAAWFASASLGCGERCLSYFNEVGGGPSRGWLYLADSNVDWGQDLDALGDELGHLGISEVTTDVSSERLLSRAGLFVVPNLSPLGRPPALASPSRRLRGDDGDDMAVPTRYFAVGVSRLDGLYSQRDLSWLQTRRLVARVNDSIFLFDMDTPAERPLAP